MYQNLLESLEDRFSFSVTSGSFIVKRHYIIPLKKYT